MQAARSHVIRLSLSVVAVLAAIAYAPSAGARVAGGSGTRTDCYSEFDGITAVPNSRPPRVECVDGDPCDTDGVCGNGFCEFKVRLCVNQVDAAIPICKAPRDGLLRLHVAPRRFAGLTDGLDLGKPSCGAVVPVAVATHFGPFGPDRPGRQSLLVLLDDLDGAGHDHHNLVVDDQQRTVDDDEHVHHDIHYSATRSAHGVGRLRRPRGRWHPGADLARQPHRRAWPDILARG